tara:strand:+ start:220 stop:423 length:204 start_codon:yes stop_codon:yes gene_type:complete
MCLQKVEKVMAQYELFKKKVEQMHSDTLKKALIIIDNAEGVSHEDFFEIAELLFIHDKLQFDILEDK